MENQVGGRYDDWRRPRLERGPAPRRLGSTFERLLIEWGAPAWVLIEFRRSLAGEWSA